MCKNEITKEEMYEILRRTKIITPTKEIKPNVIKDKFLLKQMALVYDVNQAEVRADLLRKGIYYKTLEDVYIIKNYS